MAARVVLDLHGSRARQGVEIDALEVFVRYFRAALRELDRDHRGTLPKRGGHPDARDAAASAFRLVSFRPGSGIATLEPARPMMPAADDLSLAGAGPDLSMTVLSALVETLESGERLAEPVVEALGNARRAIGEDGSFGIALTGAGKTRRVVIDEPLIRSLTQPDEQGQEQALTVIGRLHMIEVDQPGRRVGIRAQDGIDWTCTYPDGLHELVTRQVERLVRVEGEGQRITASTGRLRVHDLQPVPEHVQDPLFSIEPVSVERLRAEQGIHGPQGLAALVDPDWEDDEATRRYLEATLGSPLL